MTPTPEPWPEDPTDPFWPIRKHARLGDAVLMSLANYARARECVNACVGIPSGILAADPVTVQRELLKLRQASTRMARRQRELERERDALADAADEQEKAAEFNAELVAERDERIAELERELAARDKHADDYDYCPGDCTAKRRIAELEQRLDALTKDMHA